MKNAGGKAAEGWEFVKPAAKVSDQWAIASKLSLATRICRKMSSGARSSIG
jgi:hypothetical protein